MRCPSLQLQRLQGLLVIPHRWQPGGVSLCRLRSVRWALDGRGSGFIGIHLGLALSDRLGTEFLVGLSGLVVPGEMGGGALDRGHLPGVLPFLSFLL